MARKPIIKYNRLFSFNTFTKSTRVFIDTLHRLVPSSRRLSPGSSGLYKTWWRYPGSVQKYGAVEIHNLMEPSSFFPEAPYITQIRVNHPDTFCTELSFRRLLMDGERGPRGVPVGRSIDRTYHVYTGHCLHGPSFNYVAIPGELGEVAYKVAAIIFSDAQPTEHEIWTPSATAAWWRFQATSAKISPEELRDRIDRASKKGATFEIPDGRSLQASRTYTLYKLYGGSFKRDDELLAEANARRLEMDCLGPSKTFRFSAVIPSANSRLDGHRLPKRCPVVIECQSRNEKEAVLDMLSQWFSRHRLRRFWKIKLLYMEFGKQKGFMISEGYPYDLDGMFARVDEFLAQRDSQEEGCVILPGEYPEEIPEDWEPE